MPFFGKKKLKEKEQTRDLADFPSFDQEIKFPEFPNYESESSDTSMKEETKRFAKTKMPEFQNSYESLLEKPLIPRMAEEKQQVERQAMKEDDYTGRTFHEEKPLFVKIDDYESAIYTLDKIKAKLKEADRILEGLNKIRNEEEQQLEQWKRDLMTVKEKLLMIDKQLFES